MRLILDLV